MEKHRMSASEERRNWPIEVTVSSLCQRCNKLLPDVKMRKEYWRMSYKELCDNCAKQYTV